MVEANSGPEVVYDQHFKSSRKNYVQAKNMVEANSGPEVVYDQHFKSSRKNYVQGPSRQMGSTDAGPSRTLDHLEPKNEEMDVRKLWKEIRCLGASTMSWNERKKLEDQQVVDLGGRATKKQRLPLSVAKFMMKKKKKREQKQLEEALLLGQFVKKSKSREERRKPEDMVLRATDGHFRGGVLNVKHMLKQPNPPRSNEVPSTKDAAQKGKKNKGRGKSRGKKRGKKSRGH